MSNFSINEHDVRVDFFREQGKWYATEQLSMVDVYNYPSIHDAVRHALDVKFGKRYDDMWAVVLDPYHRHSHPVMLMKGAA
jgi:hypothetical protein